MLQSMRKGAQSTAAKVIIGLIVLSFAAFGLETLLPGGAGNSVADVNGEEITPFALQEAITQQKRQLVSIFGDDIDPAMLDDDRLRPRALDSLIQRMLLLQQTADLKLVASNAQIGKSITSVEAFQLNGVFSPDAYKSVLANAGYTPERFRRAQAEDIVLTQLQTGVSETEFSTRTELLATANFMAEERDVRYLVIPEGTLVSADDLSEAALEAYFADHRSEFMNPEQLIVDYILLTPEDFAVEIDDDAVRQQFEMVRDEYEVAEQARVSHILLIQGDDEADADYAARIAEVSERLGGGEDFADLAAALSDDLGSANIGGELGFTDGNAFPDAMEDAIATLLEPGAVSGAVETDAGVHFIRLEERIAGDSVSFEDVKEELRASMASAEAERELLVSVESLRDLVFNAADLAGPAASIGATVVRSAPFSEDNGSDLFADERLRALAFAEDVRSDRNNSEVLELSGKRFVVVRIHEIRPPQVSPFEEVEGTIRERLATQIESEALADLRARAEAFLSNGDSLEAAAEALGLEWRVELAATRLSSQLPREVLNAAFAMAADQSSVLEPVAVPAAGHALVQLARVSPGELKNLNEGERASLRARRTSEQQQLSFGEYVRSQRDSADIIVR